MYANYDNYYYVIEKMDKTLKRMIQNNSLTQIKSWNSLR